MQLDFLWTWVGFILTLLVFSYLLGDHFIFRLAASLFVGITAGYSAVLILYQVILPRLVSPLFSGNSQQILLAAVPLVLGVLLLTKLSTRLSRLGNLPMGYLVGIGAALLVGGAVTGTLTGQINAVTAGFDMRPAVLAGRTTAGALTEAAILLAGTLCTLVYFQFGVGEKSREGERPTLMQAAANIGNFFIAITLGAIFAGVFAAALAALIDRLDFITEFIFGILF
jgi:hypothetical protein